MNRRKMSAQSFTPMHEESVSNPMIEVTRQPSEAFMESLRRSKSTQSNVGEPDDGVEAVERRPGMRTFATAIFFFIVGAVSLTEVGSICHFFLLIFTGPLLNFVLF